ncbi:regulator of Ty1 Transposition, partial [Coemansia sp. RSA 1836]
MRGYTVAVDTQLLYSLSEAALARLGQRLAEAGATVARPLTAAAEASGGRRLLMAESAVADWASVDILVCQHRAGYDYCKASRLGKLVGTLVWLYEAFLSERLSAPTRRLLHYPAPAVVVGGMDRMVVAVSHYTGAARQYLIRLITALGARYTAKLTRENTHLVTAQPEGRKYAAAVQWNVHVVNHLWVERCYQRWKLLTVTHPNFSYFPDLPVLNSMVGDTEVSVDRLKAWVEAPQGASMAEWSDMDVLSDSALAADPPPPPASGKNGNGACSSGEEEMKSVGDSSSSAGEEKEREDGAAAAADDDDDEPPLVLGQRRRHTSRAAAMAASKSLGVIMQAVNTFEADMRRERLYKYRSKSHGGRRALALALEEEEEGEEKEKEKEKEKGAKRARTDKDGDSVRIMFTSVRATEQQQRQIASMGGEIVSDAAHATHLVCVEIKRTLKMLMALASGRVSIVSLAWLEHSLAQRRWVSMRAGDADPLTAKCRVVDAAAERRWSFRLE